MTDRAWRDALCSLEEWVRTLATSSQTGVIPDGPPPALPPGNVPADHRVQALALQVEMAYAYAAASTHQQNLQQQQAYTVV